MRKIRQWQKWQRSGFTLLESLLVLFIVLTISLLSYTSLHQQTIDYEATITLQAAFNYYQFIQKRAVLKGENYEMRIHDQMIDFLPFPDQSRFRRTYELPAGYHFYSTKRVKIYGQQTIAPIRIALQTPTGRKEITIQLGGQYVFKE